MILPLGLIHGSYRGKLWILIHMPLGSHAYVHSIAQPLRVSASVGSLQDSSTEQMPIAARAYSPFAS